MAHLNVNRLYNKLDSIRELLSKSSLDVLTITESWLTLDILDSEIDIDGYTAVRKDRVFTNKFQDGGIIVYIKNGINYTVRSDLTSDGIESVWVQINNQKCKPTVVGTFYRAPDENIDHFIEGLDQSLGLLDLNSIEIVILGDFNVDFTSKLSLKQKLNSCFLANDLHQLMKCPARITEHSKTVIDLICVNMQHKFVQTEVTNSHLSDHSIALCVLKGVVQKQPPRIHESRSFKNYCKQSFIDDLSSVPWNVIEATNSVDDAVSLWEHLFCSVADQHAPIKKKRLKGFSSPWVTENLISIRQDRDYFHRKARRSNGKYHWNRYRKLRNYAIREEKRLKSKYFCNLIEESKSDSHKMWSTIKKILPTNVTHLP